jgi:tetratricopeptide (TPR) repeat protein
MSLSPNLYIRRVWAVVVLAVLLSPRSGASQSAPSDLSLVGRPLLRVDLTDFRQVGRSDSAPDFANFLRTLTLLQLKSLRGIEIAGPGQGPQCLGRVTTKQTGIGAQAGIAALPMIVVAAVVTPESRRTLIDVDMTSCRADTLVRLRHLSEEIQSQEPLSQLLVLVETITRVIDGQIPRATVAIRSNTPPKPNDTLATYWAYHLADRIAQRLEGQSDLRVIEDSHSNDVDYALATDVRVLSPGVIEGRSFLTLRGSSTPVDSVVMRGTSGGERSFANAFADSTAGRFAYWRHVGDVGTSRRGEPLSDSALDVRARVSLCLDAPPNCQPNPNVAVLMLDSAIARRPTASRYLLMGRAERLSGNNANAIKAYRNALRAPGGTALEAEILSALVATLRETGDNVSAIDYYSRLVDLFPMDSLLARESALNLRLASRRIMSLRVLGSLARNYPDWPVPTSDFDVVLRGLDADEAADSAAVIAAICHKTPSLVPRCYATMAAHAVVIANGTDWPERLRSTALALISLTDSTPSRVAESHAYLALSRLRSTTLQYESPGRVKLRSDPKVVLDSVLRPLEIARLSAEQAGDSTLREWVLRLRSQYALLMGNPDDAFVFALRADSLLRSTASKRLAASAALLDTDKRFLVLRNQKRLGIADSLITPLLANTDPQIYLMFIQVKHRLGQDTAARDTLQRIYRAFPTNTVARWALGMVCSEFIKDRQCAFRTWRDAWTAGRIRNYGDTLNAVEAALGADSVETAAKWLGPALVRPADVCRKTVAYLFAYWIAGARSDEPARISAQRQWDQSLATGTTRNAIKNCWIFEGGKEAMARRGPSPLPAARKAELLQMMRQIDPD